jgi:hypothetical protein
MMDRAFTIMLKKLLRNLSILIWHLKKEVKIIYATLTHAKKLQSRMTTTHLKSKRPSSTLINPALAF